MSAAIIDTAGVTESNATGLPQPGKLDIIFQLTSEKNLEVLVSIDETNNEPSIDAQSLKPYSQNSENNVDSNLNSVAADHSQESHDEENISIPKAPTSTLKRKYRNFLDSDSEEDENSTVSTLNKSDSDKESIGTLEFSNRNVQSLDTQARRKNSRRLADSDSDEDKTLVGINIDNDEDQPGDESNTARETEVTKPSQSKISAIIDTESDEGSDRTSPAIKRKKSTSSRKKKEKNDTVKEKSRFSTLVDTDSEDHVECNNVEQMINKRDENGIPSKKSGKAEKKRTGSIRAAKDEAMRQIHSETQRLVRSSAVSLPYHRPKQRSLEDFLNRKKFIPALPEGLTTAAKVKMSSEIVGKVLEEKEKEAELFYKSSDSEDETVTCTPVNHVEDPSDSSALVLQIPIEDTQKVLKNDVQNSHNKKDIIMQSATDIGVPRKLFVDEPQDSVENDKPANVETSVNDEEEESVITDPKKNMREAKHGLREGNAPQKLFPSDYDEGVDSPPKDEETSTLTARDTPSVVEPRKAVEPELENIDEGIHSFGKINECSPSSETDGNDFVLKFPDLALPDGESIREIDASTDKNIANETAELLNISETPFITSKEYAKLNEREKSIKSRENLADTSDVDDDSGEPAFGHVYGLPPPDIEDNCSILKTSSVKKKLLSTLSNVEPRLRGSPGMIIDLSSDVRPNKEGVKSLVDRLIRHSTVNKATGFNSPVTVLHAEKTADGVKIVEEILPYKLPVSNDVQGEKELQKPGAKYARLKNDLIEKMAKKRGEEWRLKEQKEKNEICEDTEDDYDEEADVKLADEEFEGSTESEPEEEDDVTFVKRKKRKLREFADEEAEVSGQEEEEEEEDDDDDDEEAIEVGHEGEVEEDQDETISLHVDEDDDTVDNFSNTEESTAKNAKRPSRIAKAFEDDSNSLPADSFADGGIEPRGKALKRTKTDVDMFEPENENEDWLSDTESEFPPSQILPRDQADARSQICKTPLTAINALRFVSPITQLTALNSSNDSPRNSPASNDVSRRSQLVAESFSDKTPIGINESPISRDSEKRIGFQKKLFEDPAGTVNDEELMDLCSGKFTNAENDAGLVIDAMGTSSVGRVTETQLLGLCSGSFSSQLIDLDKYEDKLDENVEATSRDVRLTLNVDSDASSDSGESKETRIESKTPWTLQVDSSSDDEASKEPRAAAGKKRVLKKKKVQKLDLSDDEEISNEEEEADVLDDDVAENKYVDYDSEENEVSIVPKSDIRKAAADFLEAEAELSESEWGSEDEDEKGLDRLEFEAGDDEEIDENQMRDQLGKIHMRQVQDDDQREVRMLQELLFDDGDLHTDGSGRERKFRWKNIDQLGDDDDAGPRNNDGDENGDPIEEENDLEWRKERIEREKFIEDKMKLSIEEVVDELAVDSQVFKLGIKALKRGKSSQCSQKESEPAVTKPTVPRTVLDLVGSPSLGQNTRILHRAVTRGSFLARGDECLARLAVRIKHSSETTIAGRTDPRNFLFARISPSVEETTEKEEEDAPLENSSSSTKARKRKPAAGITPRSTKKAKLDVNRPTGKKLF